MKSTIAKWEDEENNRQVQFSVDYSIEVDEIEIVDITPRQVDFSCENKNSVGVHTTKGKIHLAEKIQASGYLNQVKIDIAKNDNLLATV